MTLASRLAPFALSVLVAACGPVDRDGLPDALVTPDSAGLDAPAPESYTVVMTTSEGDVTIRVTRQWSPRAADRFHWFASNGFFEGQRFFRVVDDFVVQWGLIGIPALDQEWQGRSFPDDLASVPNRRGTIVFARTGAPDSRANQLFINLVDNVMLDAMGFAPFGEVIEGMDVIDRLYAGYGEGAPMGSGPDQMRLVREGNRYLDENFPQLDSIVRTVVR
jgi:peptidyl-prolyl cis-trans isomerase A (cyclophilin A)